MTPWPATVRRLVYFGTPGIAVAPLRALCDAGFEVTLAVTGPDRRRRRRGAAEPSAVSRAAAGLGIPVTHRPEDAVGAAGDADGAVVVAYGRLIGAEVLDVLPAVNVHFSLLPRWRGAAPMERAILAGDTSTGVSLMALTETLDAGPLYDQAATSIGADETLAELRDRLVALSCPLLVELLRAGRVTPWRRKVRSPGPTRSARTTSASTGTARPRSCSGRSASAGPGPRWTGSASASSGPPSLPGTRNHAGPAGLLEGLVVGTAAGVVCCLRGSAGRRSPGTAGGGVAEGRPPPRNRPLRHLRVARTLHGPGRVAA